MASREARTPASSFNFCARVSYVWSPEVLFCTLQAPGMPACDVLIPGPLSPGPIFLSKHRLLWQSPLPVSPRTSNSRGHVSSSAKDPAPPMPPTSASSQHPAGVLSWCLLLASIRVSRSDSPGGPPSAGLGGREHSVTRMTVDAAPPLAKGLSCPIPPAWSWMETSGKRGYRPPSSGELAGPACHRLSRMALSAHLPTRKSRPAPYDLPTVSSSLHLLSLPALHIR